MKKLLFILAVLASSCSTVKTAPQKQFNNSQNDSLSAGTVRHEQDIPCYPGNKHFLWDVRGASNNIYILGSIHLGKPELYPLDSAIMHRFENSKNLVVEVNIKSDSFKTKISGLVADAQYPQGTSLKTELSEIGYALLKKKCESLGIDIAKLHQMKIWAIMMTIQQLELAKLGMVEEFGIESFFLNKAEGVKNILELENVGDQLSLIEDIMNSEKYLTYSLNALHALEGELNSILKAWKCGDTEYLEEYLLDEMKKDEHKEMYESLFRKRNISMTHTISEYLNDTDDYFIIVGAGHLVGKDSIIDLLRKKGLTVIQI